MEDQLKKVTAERDEARAALSHAKDTAERNRRAALDAARVAAKWRRRAEATMRALKPDVTPTDDFSPTTMAVLGLVDPPPEDSNPLVYAGTVSGGYTSTEPQHQSLRKDDPRISVVRADLIQRLASASGQLSVDPYDPPSLGHATPTPSALSSAFLVMSWTSCFPSRPSDATKRLPFWKGWCRVTKPSQESKEAKQLKEVNDRVVLEFGQRLTAEMMKRRIGRTEMRDASGIPYDTIARIERGERVPNLRTCARLASGLGIPVSSLLDKLLSP